MPSNLLFIIYILPVFAQIIFVGVINTDTPVEPLWSCPVQTGSVTLTKLSKSKYDLCNIFATVSGSGYIF